MKTGKIVLIMFISFLAFLVLVALIGGIFGSGNKLENMKKERDYYKTQMMNFCKMAKSYDSIFVNMSREYEGYMVNQTGEKKLLNKPCSYWKINETDIE